MFAYGILHQFSYSGSSAFLYNVLFLLSCIGCLHAIFRRPPDKLEECNKPLGMYSGAISNISANHFDTVPSCVKNGGRLGTQEYWCSNHSPSPPVYYEIKFKQVSIITGYFIHTTFNHFVNCYFGYSFGDTPADFQFLFENGKLLTIPTSSYTNETIWFKTPVRARMFRIHFEVTLGKNFSTEAVKCQFEFFGCPHWNYAKPLGMSSGMISSSRITACANEQKSDPLLARFDSYGFGWYPYGNVEEQDQVSDPKYWLQITLPTLKKIIYIDVQGFNTLQIPPRRYRILYGTDESSLEQYYENREDSDVQIKLPETAAFANSTHVFSYPLICSVIRYVPIYNNVKHVFKVRMELYGVDSLTPDHNWKLLNPYPFIDSIQFEDLRQSAKINFISEYYTWFNNGAVSRHPQLRTEEIPANDCLMDPDFCNDGFATSFWFSKIQPIKVQQKEYTATNISQYSTTCKQLDIDNQDVTNSMFAFHFDNLEILQFQTIHSTLKIIGEHYQPAMKTDVMIYVNQHKSYVAKCEYATLPVQHIFGGEVSLSNVIDLSFLMQNMVNSNFWKVGMSLSIVFKLAESFAIVRKGTLTFELLTACAAHNSDIVSELDQPRFSVNHATNCDSQPYEMKFGENGFETCRDDMVFTIDLAKPYHITAVKVAGLKNAIPSKLNIMRSFYLKDSLDGINWRDSQMLYVRKQLSVSRFEVIPLSFPVLAQYVQVIPKNKDHIGTNHGFRFDVITCHMAEDKLSSWMKLNDESVCVGAKNNAPGKIILSGNVDISFFKLDHLSGKFTCSSSYAPNKWGCVNHLATLVTDAGNNSLLEIPIVNQHQRYKMPPYNVNSSELQFKINGSRYFRHGQELNVWHTDDLYDILEVENEGVVCMNVYGWGRPYPHRWLVTRFGFSNIMCVYVYRNMELRADASCKESFFLTVASYLVHSATGKCVSNDGGNLMISNACSDKFIENMDGYIQLKSSNKLLFVSNDKVQVAAAMATPTTVLLLKDSVSFVNNDIPSTYFSSNYIMSKETATDVHDASRKCSVHNSDLVSIHSKEEAYALGTFLKKNFLLSKYLIGLENPSNKVYKWIDGTPFDMKEDIQTNSSSASISSSCTVIEKTTIHQIVCAPQRFICKKRYSAAGLYSKPLISSGLHAVGNYRIGKGFIIFFEAKVEFSMSVIIESDGISCYGNVELSSAKKVTFFGFSWSKKKNELNLYLNGKNVGNASCTDLSSFDVTSRNTTLTGLLNFINIGGYYDQTQNFFGYNHRYNLINDIRVWRHYLTNTQFTHVYMRERVTFSESYSVTPMDESWQILNSCTKNTAAPCKDVDMHIAKDVDCLWFDGGPIGTSTNQLDVHDEMECLYRCSLNRSGNSSINGVSYTNKLCMCVHDMYKVDASTEGQRSCFLPVTVKNGPQTMKGKITSIKINPVNKMWYGIGVDNFLYRHPARTSINLDLFTKVYDDHVIKKFEFHDEDIWLLKNDSEIVIWPENTFPSGEYLNMAVGKHYMLGIGLNKNLYVVRIENLKDLYQISNHGDNKMVTCDKYNNQYLITKIDGSVHVLTDKDIPNQVGDVTYSEIFPATDSIIQIVISMYGNVYLKDSTKIQRWTYDGAIVDVAIPMSFNDFDVIDDEYLIGMDDEGTLHQYTIKPVISNLQARAASIAIKTFRNESNVLTCSSNQKQFVKLDAVQTATIFNFIIHIQEDVIIDSAVISFEVNNTVMSSPMGYNINILRQPVDSSETCEKKIQPANFQLVETVYWNIISWNNKACTTDISSLIQYAVNHDWFYGKVISVIFSPVDEHTGNEITLEFDKVQLDVRFKNHKPNNYLSFPSITSYGSYTTDAYSSHYQSLSFWLYMSEKGRSTLFVWEDIVMLCRIRNDHINSTWKQIHVPLSSTDFFKLHFIVHNAMTIIDSAVAIDNIEVHGNVTSEISKEFIAIYHPDDKTSYLDVLKTLKLPTPLLLYPLALRNYVTKDYSLHQLDLLGHNSMALLNDKYYMFNHGVKFIKLRGPWNQDISTATNAIENEFSFAFHLKPDVMTISTFVFQFGDDSHKIKIFTVDSSITISISKESQIINASFNTQIGLKRWTYLCVTYSNGHMRLFVNNTLDSAVDVPLSLTRPFPQSIYIFNYPESPIPSDNIAFNGYISCLQVYNKSLSLAEMKAVEYCPNRQDMYYHSLKCKNGLNVAFGAEQCACYDVNLRHQTEACRNAFSEGVYRDALVYIPFDYEEESTDEKGEFRLQYQAFGNIVLKPGPMDYAACVNHNSSTIGSVGAPCSGDFFTCTEGYVIGFWFYLADRESETEWIKVFGFGDIVINVKFSSNNASIHADADIKWNLQTCINTIFPINSWVYINIELLPSSFKMFFNGKHIVKNGPCQYPTGSNNNQMMLRIASHVCIDEFSITAISNPPSVETEYVYKQYLFWNSSDYHKKVVVKLVITSTDFYQPVGEEYAEDEKRFIYQTVHKMLIDFFKQLVSNETRYVDYKPMDVKKADPDEIAVSLLASLTYVDFEIENAFFISPKHSFGGREYCIKRDLNEAAIGIQQSPLNFTATGVNSTVLSLQIFNLDSEDKRYHHSYYIHVVENHLLVPTTFNQRNKTIFLTTGKSVVHVTGISPFRNCTIYLWSLTHQGYGPRGMQSVLSPKDVNLVPPQNVTAYNTSHTTIKVEWGLYRAEYWNSDKISFRVYWRMINKSDDPGNDDLFLYNYTDANTHLSNLEEHNNGGDAFTSFELTSLEAFTNYSILVATRNDVGVGSHTGIYCMSDQWLPEEAPYVVSVNLLTNDTLSLHWKYTSDVDIYNSWKLLGYNITIEPLYPSLSNAVLKESLVPVNELSFNSSHLDYFQLFKLGISAYNLIGYGPSFDVCFATGGGVPNDDQLSVFELINNTFNSINLRIGKLPRKAENGIVTHYKVKYKLEDLENDYTIMTAMIVHSASDLDFWKKMSNISIPCTVTSPPNSSKVVNVNITGLHPYTRYKVEVAVCTEVNCSSYVVNQKVFLTNETFPCAPNISMWNTSSSEMFVSIDSFDQMCLNGFLKYYHVVMLDSVFYADIIENLSLENIPTQHMGNITVASYTATQLKKYWNYTAVVYIENRFGNGPFSSKWAFTAEDAPDGPPTNILGYGNSSTSIILNVSLPLLEVRNGIIRGYEVHVYNLFKVRFEREQVFNINDEKTSILFLKNLSKFTNYEIKVRAFTTVGSGQYSSPAITIRTLEDIPSAAPLDFNITAVSANDVDLNWKNVPEDLVHGVLRSFQLEIIGILANNSLHTLPPLNISYNRYTDVYTSHISGLFPHTTYNCSIQGCTTPGCGVNRTLKFTTDEMVPVGTIHNLRQFDHTVKKSLHFDWTDILPMEKRGKIVNFSITYNKYEKLWEAPDNTLLSFLVSGDQFNASIFNLDNFTTYQIKVLGRTKKGEGPKLATDMRTPENVPNAAPEITYANNISSSAINIKFTKLLPPSWQGEPLGYYIYNQYADEQTNCTPGFVCSKMEYTKCFGADIEGCDVVGLDLHTNYSVCVAGFTNAGPGPMSICMHVITDTFVNGNWTEWSEWGHCDRSCANGTEVRLRFCINPIPSRGGADCSGSGIDSRPCNDFPCSGFYLAKPLTDCTETCNDLSNNDVGMKFSCSYVINTKNVTHVFETSLDGYDYTNVEGTSCSTDDSKKIYSEEYHPAFLIRETICAGYTRVPGRIKCSIDGVLSETYRRLCYCVDREQATYTPWAVWGICTKTCATGTLVRFRSCLLEHGCNKTVDVKDCNTQLCPIDGSWGEWSEFGDCSKSCNFGVRTRKRYCNSPPPLFNGRKCDGDDIDIIEGCSPGPCPRDGGWSTWRIPELCTRPCGVGGQNIQRRYCNNPSPKYDGAPCSGSSLKIIPCNEEKSCDEVGVTFIVTMTNETWHYTMHYPNSVDGQQIRNKLITAVMTFMSNSPVGTSVIADIQLNELRRGSVIANFTVFYYGNSFIESLVLQNTIDNVGFIDTVPVKLLSISSNDIPETTPLFTAVSKVFDKIKISWEDDTTWDTSTLPGDFYLYYIFYRDLTTPNNNWTSVGTPNKSIELIDLKGNTWYGLRIIVGTNQSNGIASPEKKVKTMDGVPLTSPPNFDYREMSASSIYLTWDEIPKKDIPGTLLGYKIVYKRLDNNLTLSITTAADTLQRTINDLKPATYYFFEINGYTVTGFGPLSFLTLETSYDAPGVAPPNVTWEDRISSHHINIAWRPIPKDEENGYVVGYKIRYILIRQSDKDEPPSDTPEEKEVDRFTFSITIDKLSAYAEYKFEVFAFAKEGDGPIYTFTAGTCKCPQNIYANFHTSRPYIYHDTSVSNDIQGFFPSLLSTILRGVCTECTAYRSPNIYFDRTPSGQPAEKLNLRQVKESVGNTVQLTMPIYGKFEVTRFAGVYPYIGIVRTQGSAAIMYDHKVKIFHVIDLLKSIAATWIIVVMIALLSAVCGCILWLTEQRSLNSDFAIDNFCKGFFQGMWMAFITLGTVGYGDYAPSTRASKVLIIVWTLIGMIMTSIFVASISTSMTSQNIEQEIVLYGTPTAAIPGTAEYNLAVLRNAQVYNVSEPSDVLMAVNKNIVQIGLLDALVATSYENQLQELSLTVKKIYDTNSGYGTVLSGGLESIEDDLRSYVDANKVNIDAFVGSQIKILKPNVTIIETQLIPRDEIVEYIVLLCYTFIGVYLFGGLIWFVCLRRRKRIIQPLATKEEMMKTKLAPCIEKFAKKFPSIIEKLEQKHFSELSRLIVLRTNFIRLLTRNGHTEEEVRTKLEAIRVKHVKRIKRRQRKMKYLEGYTC